MKKIITAISLIIAFSASAQTSVKSEIKTKNSSHDLSELQVKARLLTSGKIQNGSTLTFVLSEPASISKITTKKGQTISGIARESNGRLYVDVNNVKIDGKVYPAKIKVCSENGIEGFSLSGRTPNSRKPIEIPNNGANAIIIIYN